jgi:leucyl aminopeptidase
MKILTQKTSTALSSPLDLLVIPVTEKTVPKVVAKSNYKEIIEHHIKNGDLTDQAGSSVLFYPNGKDQSIKRIVLIQLGKAKTSSKGEVLAKALKTIVHKYEKVGIVLPSTYEKEASKLCLDSVLFNNFQFFHHKTNVKESDKHKIESFILFSDKNIDKAISEAQITNDAIETIRHLPSHQHNTKLAQCYLIN